jgi:hypothetical protein
LPIYEAFWEHLLTIISTGSGGIVCPDLPKFEDTLNVKPNKVTFFVTSIDFSRLNWLLKTVISFSSQSLLIPISPLPFVYLRLNFLGMAIAFTQGNGGQFH